MLFGRETASSGPTYLVGSWDLSARDNRDQPGGPSLLHVSISSSTFSAFNPLKREVEGAYRSCENRSQIAYMRILDSHAAT